MNRKKFYLITTILAVAVLISFEIIIYCFVGVDSLAKPGIARTIWLGFPVLVICFTLLRDFIIAKSQRK